MKIGRFKTMSISIKAVILGLYVVGGSVLAQTLPLPRSLITFNSAQGEQLLLESKARKDYWNLSMQFVTQNNQAFSFR